MPSLRETQERGRCRSRRLLTCSTAGVRAGIQVRRNSLGRAPHLARREAFGLHQSVPRNWAWPWRSSESLACSPLPGDHPNPVPLRTKRSYRPSGGVASHAVQPAVVTSLKMCLDCRCAAAVALAATYTHSLSTGIIGGRTYGHHIKSRHLEYRRVANQWAHLQSRVPRSSPRAGVPSL